MRVTSSKSLKGAFARDVFKGLSAYPKSLPSKYIYDKRGDKLFQQIMELPEYYLTNCEFEILSTHKEAIGDIFDDPEGFDLVELGAGDGQKTKILLSHFLGRELDFHYMPIDISQNALDKLRHTLEEELPTLSVEPQQGSYFEVLERLNTLNQRKKVIMMLGSNIGNLLHPDAVDFLSHIQHAMHSQDLLFIGFDQKKDPQMVLDAYNDATGVTEAFNKNLLVRINRELEADFNVDAFAHWETYDPETGTAKSYLVAKEEQSVTIEALDLTTTFHPWETIHVEISQKYDDKVVQWLAEQAGLCIQRSFADGERYYKDYVLGRHY